MKLLLRYLVISVTVKGIAVGWLLLVASLPGGQGALRLRLWRSLKALGAAVLRDGVYLAPANGQMAGAFNDRAAEISSAGGSAFVLDLQNGDKHEEFFRTLFDRSAQYAQSLAALEALAAEFERIPESEARRRLRQLMRDVASIEATDFFPGSGLEGARAALDVAHQQLDMAYSPEEPLAVHKAVPSCDPRDFQHKVWATRAHIWIDRICSAWLIRRFIDKDARFLWLPHPVDCPASAVGFDFDGAQFTHIDQYVTFEVLLKSFDLAGDEALQRLAAIVHFLDVGGPRVPEAAGLEAILSGARARCESDDQLLNDVCPLLDDLHRAFDQPASVG